MDLWHQALISLFVVLPSEIAFIAQKVIIAIEIVSFAFRQEADPFAVVFRALPDIFLFDKVPV